MFLGCLFLKVYCIRGGEHGALTFNNFTIGENYIKFEENECKTFHGGLLHLKYKPRIVRHVCREEGKFHETHCLV